MITTGRFLLYLSRSQMFLWLPSLPRLRCVTMVTNVPRSLRSYERAGNISPSSRFCRVHMHVLPTGRAVISLIIRHARRSTYDFHSVSIYDAGDELESGKNN